MEPPKDNELPAPLDALWEARSERGRRPRKRGLTVDRVVAAAVELADADGLDALSMSRVAERLGFSTMSLYRHVRSKEELVTLMVDVATEPPTSAQDAAEGWRSGLERWSWDLLAVVRRHPWLLQVALPRVPFGPRRLAWLDRGLQALADTTLNEDEKAAIILLLNGYVFSEARVATEVGNPRQGSEAQSAATEQLEVLSALVDRQRFPALRRALDAGIFDPPGAGRDADFAFGLERFLDGVERLVTERADERQPPPGAAREGD